MHRAQSLRLEWWHNFPASAHQRNLRCVTSPSSGRAKFCFRKFSLFHTTLKVDYLTPRVRCGSSGHLLARSFPLHQLCVCKRSRRGRHSAQVPQARGPHRTQSDAFPVDVQKRSRLFHPALRKGLFPRACRNRRTSKARGDVYAVRSRHRALWD